MSESSYVRSPAPQERAYMIPVGQQDVKRMDAMAEIFNPQSIAWMNKHCKDAGTVFDVGCGNGSLTVPFASQSNARVLGADISREQIDLAKKYPGSHHPDLFRRLQFEQSNALDAAKLHAHDPFDVVHCRFLLTNLPSPADVADGLLQCVCPGGKLVMQELFDVDIIFAQDGHCPLPRALKAWQALIRLQHQLQGSTLATAPLLTARFPEARIQYARCVVDGQKKRLFVESSLQFKAKLLALPGVTSPLPGFGYADIEEWCAEMKAVQDDDSVYVMPFCCIVVNK